MEENLYYLKVRNIFTDSGGIRFRILDHKKDCIVVCRHSEIEIISPEIQIPFEKIPSLLESKSMTIIGCGYENERDKILLQNEISGIVKKYEISEKTKKIETLSDEHERLKKDSTATIEGIESLNSK